MGLGEVDFRHLRYFSPYPPTETEADDVGTSQGASHATKTPTHRIPGVNRSSTVRSHTQTSNSGLDGTQGSGTRPILWVCDQCFKYMTVGLAWELHMVRSESVGWWVVELMGGRAPRFIQKKCERKHPPGRKVYQRGAHIIWEVDGAKEKVIMVVFLSGLLMYISFSSIVRIFPCSGSYSST